MVTFTIQCSDCGADASISIGQAVADSKLAWSESTRCSNCGLAIESDDSGLPPNSIRYQIIESAGRWGLLIIIEGPERIKMCKILHPDLKMTMIEIAQLKDRMPGVVYTGTRTEMEWLRGRLSHFGVDSSVVQQCDDANAQSIDIGRLSSIAFQEERTR